MKLLKAWLFIGVFLCSNAWAQADPPSQVGRLSYLSGTVSFAPAEAANDWSVAPLNRPVTTGDRLWADRDGRAEVRIGSTALRLNALTSMDVLRLDDQVTQLRLAQGTLNVQLRRLDTDESFEISTPGGAVLLTQPGSYRVTVDPSGATTTVLVRRGQADVLSGNAPIPLRDNQLVALSAQGAQTFAAPAPDEFDNWAAARDRQEERIVSTRYVPQEMTGYEDLDQYGNWQSATQYGDVWVPAAVPAGWAPYRDGRWVWVSPWGWTWVDNARWGFAPYHYGRWVWLGQRWGWSPGARTARPVYAPALVAFVGGSNWSVSAGAGPAVGWVPLGWREPYIPWYRHSPAYVRNVNITQVTNINVIQQYSDVNNAGRIRYINRDVPSATTVVSRETFVSARRVQGAQLNIAARDLSAARVMHDAPVIRPERHSFAAARAGARLPDAVAAREVIAARAPLAPARFGNDGAPGNRPAAEERPRVRVLNAQGSITRPLTPDASARQQPAASAAPPAFTPGQRRERAAETPDAGEPPRAPLERRDAAPRANAGAAAPEAAARRPAPAAEPAPGSRTPPERRDATQRANTGAPAPDGAARRQPAEAATPPAVVPAPVRERAAEPAPGTVQQPRAPQERRDAAPRATTPAPAQADMQRQQQEQRERQAHDEQQRQARAQARQQQQERQQAQKEQQHQAVQQRNQEVQQQRERQFQQAQQVQQQQQQAREHRQAERAESQRQAAPRAPQAPPPAAAPAPAPNRGERRAHDAERAPQPR